MAFHTHSINLKLNKQLSPNLDPMKIRRNTLVKGFLLRFLGVMQQSDKNLQLLLLVLITVDT